MKSLLPIVLAAAFVVPVWADECSEFRDAVRARDAARLLLMGAEANEDVIGELMGEVALAGSRIEEGAEALVTRQGDHLAADMLAFLDEADIAASKASGAAWAMGSGPQASSTSDLRDKALQVQFAIEAAREALVYTLCP